MKPLIHRIFIPETHNPALDESRTKIGQEFQKAGFEVTKEISDANLVVVIGGDGALLNTLQKYDYPDIPFVGINKGTLGFLQEIEAEQTSQFIENIKAGKYYLSKLPLLEFKSGELTGLAFNEVVIERASAQATHLSIAVNHVVFDKFIGDGLIISTPQGSSAYALAAGGAFLSDGVSAMQLVPINPHNTVAYRSLHAPLVVDIESSIEVKNLETKHRPIRILADGIECEGDSTSIVKISLSKRQATLLRGENYSYFDMLARKFIK